MQKYLHLLFRLHPSQPTSVSTAQVHKRPLKRFWIGVMGEALMTLGVAGIATSSPMPGNPPHTAIAISLFLFFLGLFVLSISLSSRRQAEKSRGQGMLEYALIIALVAVVVIASLVLLGPQIAGILLHVSTAL